MAFHKTKSGAKKTDGLHSENLSTLESATRLIGQRCQKLMERELPTDGKAKLKNGHNSTNNEETLQVFKPFA